MIEIWDAYDEAGRCLNVDLIRGEKILDGMYHLVSCILVQHSDGDLLMMKRDFNKKGFPGCYELTAGGSVLKGKDALSGAKRELFEETGIKSENFKFEFKYIDKKSHGIFYVYTVITDVNKNDIVLQKGEIIDYEWISPENLNLKISFGPEMFIRHNLINIAKCSVLKNLKMYLSF